MEFEGSLPWHNNKLYNTNTHKNHGNTENTESER